jgi:hypothetical protein
MLESVHARRAAERSQEMCAIPPSRRHGHRECSSRDLTTVVRSQSSVFFAGSFTHHVAKHLPTPRAALIHAQSPEIASERRKAPTPPPVRRACKVFAIGAKRLLRGRRHDTQTPRVLHRLPPTATGQRCRKPAKLLELAARGGAKAATAGRTRRRPYPELGQAAKVPLPASSRARHGDRLGRSERPHIGCDSDGGLPSQPVLPRMASTTRPAAKSRPSKLRDLSDGERARFSNLERRRV